MKNIITVAVLGLSFTAGANPIEMRENQIYKAAAKTAHAINEAVVQTSKVAYRTVEASVNFQKDMTLNALTHLGLDVFLERLGMVGINDECTGHTIVSSGETFITCITPTGLKYRVSNVNFFASRAAALTVSAGTALGSMYLEYKLAVIFIAAVGALPATSFVGVPMAAYFLYQGMRNIKFSEFDANQVTKTCTDCKIDGDLLTCRYCKNRSGHSIFGQQLNIAKCEAGSIKNQNGKLTCRR